MIYPKHIVYSLEALAYLASPPENKYIKAQDVASKLHIPRHFLGKVLTDLVKKRLVMSIKGPSGGFALAANSANISIYRILTKLGGLEKLEDSCVMGLSECTEESPCALHDLWTDFREKTISKTQKLTLEEFSQTFMNKLQSVK